MSVFDNEGGSEGEVAASDIEASVQAEVQGIKQSRKQSSMRQDPKFQAVRHDTQCVLFFKTRPPVNAVDFVHQICKDAKQGIQQRKCRFVKRLTPMTRMGKATMDGLEGICGYVLADGIGSEGTKFAIRPTIRDHNVLRRDDIIQTVAQAVARSGSAYKVDLKTPDVWILVEVYRNVLGMSLVPGDYEMLKRFNLAEILEPTSTVQNSGST